LAGNLAKGVELLPDKDIANELTSALLARYNRIGRTLAYMFYELACHPHWLAQLRAELEKVPFNQAVRLGVHGLPDGLSTSAAAAAAAAGSNGSAHDEEARMYFFPELRVLQDLLVLNAVITETLRMHPVLPAKLVHEAPAAGSSGSSGGATVAGVWVPAGTVVSVLLYTLQRTASVFQQPDARNLARWFTPPASAAEHTCAGVDGGDGNTGDDGDNGGSGGMAVPKQAVVEAAAALDGAQGTVAMRAYMLLFSRGLRVCIGRGIALAEMRLMLAAVARRFASIRMVDTGQMEADMPMTDFLLLIPCGHHCMLVFE
jgi:cytochrome P450